MACAAAVRKKRIEPRERDDTPQKKFKENFCPRTIPYFRYKVEN